MLRLLGRPGKALFDRLTCPKEFRLFTKAEGAEGHCEGMAPSSSGPPPSTGWTTCSPEPMRWRDNLIRGRDQEPRRINSAALPLG
jgi:hypothetical protein